VAACRHESAPEAHEPLAQNYEPFDALAEFIPPKRGSLAQGDLLYLNLRKVKTYHYPKSRQGLDRYFLTVVHLASYASFLKKRQRCNLSRNCFAPHFNLQWISD